MRKIVLILMTLGFGAGFGYAHANGDPACYAACDVKLDACLAAGISTPAVCHKVFDMCYERCDYEAGLP